MISLVSISIYIHREAHDFSFSEERDSMCSCPKEPLDCDDYRTMAAARPEFLHRLGPVEVIEYYQPPSGPWIWPVMIIIVQDTHYQCAATHLSVPPTPPSLWKLTGQKPLAS